MRARINLNSRTKHGHGLLSWLRRRIFCPAESRRVGRVKINLLFQSASETGLLVLAARGEFLSETLKHFIELAALNGTV